VAKALQFSVLITKTFLPEKLEVVLSTVGESGFLLIENVVISLGESAAAVEDPGRRRSSAHNVSPKYGTN
jgi:hypothetical protein